MSIAVTWCLHTVCTSGKILSIRTVNSITGNSQDMGLSRNVASSNSGFTRTPGSFQDDLCRVSEESAENPVGRIKGTGRGRSKVQLLLAKSLGSAHVGQTAAWWPVRCLTSPVGWASGARPPQPPWPLQADMNMGRDS